MNSTEKNAAQSSEDETNNFIQPNNMYKIKWLWNFAIKFAQITDIDEALDTFGKEIVMGPLVVVHLDVLSESATENSNAIYSLQICFENIFLRFDNIDENSIFYILNNYMIEIIENDTTVFPVTSDDVLILNQFFPEYEFYTEIQSTVNTDTEIISQYLSNNNNDYLSKLERDNDKINLNAFLSFFKNTETTFLSFFMLRHSFEVSPYFTEDFFEDLNKNFTEIDFNNYLVLHELSRTTNRKILLCINKETGHLFVKMKFDNELEYLREKFTYSKIDIHPNIIFCYGYNDSEQSLLKEYMTRGTLDIVLTKHDLDDTRKTQIVLQILNGIDHLHSHGIIHCQIKASSILIDKYFNAYISNFGISIFYDAEKKILIDEGNKEIFNMKNFPIDHFSFQSDLYSFGLLIFEIATSRKPIPTQSFLDSDDLTRYVDEIDSIEFPPDQGRFVYIYQMLVSKDIKDRVCSYYILDCMINDKLYFKETDVNYITDLIQQDEIFMKDMSLKDRSDILFIIDQANGGNDLYQFYLGNLYSLGIFLEQDLNQAIEWYTKSAEQGNPHAQYSLGFYYENGQFVEQNLSKAIELYTLSSEQGYANAQNNLALCYEIGKGVEKNISKAIELYKMSAEKKNPDAQYNLAFCYENGIGVDCDFKLAISLYEKASALGNSNALYNLALFYQKGIGVEQNVGKAIELFTKSTELGNSKAQFSLGIFYENGIGVDQNIDLALKLYNLSASQGNEEAQMKLEAFQNNKITVGNSLSQLLEFTSDVVYTMKCFWDFSTNGAYITDLEFFFSYIKDYIIMEPIFIFHFVETSTMLENINLPPMNLDDNCYSLQICCENYLLCFLNISTENIKKLFQCGFVKILMRKIPIYPVDDKDKETLHEILPEVTYIEGMSSTTNQDVEELSKYVKFDKVSDSTQRENIFMSFLQKAKEVLLSFYILRNYHKGSPFYPDLTFEDSNKVFKERDFNDYIQLHQLSSNEKFSNSLCISKEKGHFYIIRHFHDDTYYLNEKTTYSMTKFHSNILFCYGFNDEQSSLLLAANAILSIKDYSEINGIDNTLKTKILLQSLNALDYLHSVGIINHKLDCSTLMIDKYQNVEITDFSSTYVYDTKQKSIIDYRTNESVSEEKLDFTPFKSDLYSYGLLIKEVGMLGQQYHNDQEFIQECGRLSYLYQILMIHDRNDFLCTYSILDSMIKRNLYFKNSNIAFIDVIIERDAILKNHKVDPKDTQYIIDKATSGDSVYQTILGNMYYSGISLPHDYEQCIYWLKQAVEKNNSHAQYSLALCYENGEGVPQDYNKAFELYSLSASQGNSYSQNNLAHFYFNRNGADIDINKGIELYTQSAEQGNSDAQYNLALCYQNGDGVQIDYNKAYEYFTKSATQGNNDAQFVLAVCYETGKGTERNINKSIELYYDLANNGNSDAKFIISLYCAQLKINAKHIPIFLGNYTNCIYDLNYFWGFSKKCVIITDFEYFSFYVRYSLVIGPLIVIHFSNKYNNKSVQICCENYFLNFVDLNEDSVSKLFEQKMINFNTTVTKIFPLTQEDSEKLKKIIPSFETDQKNEEIIRNDISLLSKHLYPKGKDDEEKGEKCMFDNFIHETKDVAMAYYLLLHDFPHTLFNEQPNQPRIIYSSNLNEINDENQDHETEIEKKEFCKQKYEDYIYLHKLGTGVSGKVSLAVSKQNGKLFAVKEYFVEEMYLSDKKNFSAIGLIPNVIFCYGFCDSHKMLFFDYMGFGNLQELLKRKELNDTEKTLIIIQIINGIDYLHSIGIVHQDIKLSSIWVNYNYEVFIGNFTKACKYNPDKDIFVSISTNRIKTEEEVRNEKISFQTDIYAFGALIYELVTNDLSLISQSNIFELFDKIENNLIPRQSYKIGPIYNLLKLLLSKEKKTKTSSYYILNYLVKNKAYFKTANTKVIEELIKKQKIMQNNQTNNRCDVKYINNMANKGIHLYEYFNGVINFQGLITKINYKESFKWFLKSSETNNQYALFNVAFFYENGFGVEKDQAKAIEYYTKSADLNYTNAINCLAVCYKKGNGVEKDIHKAIQLFEKSAELNDPEAQCILASMYHLNENIDHDYQRSIELYRKSAEQGNSIALYNLSNCYMVGEFVEKDPSLAVEYLEESADLGNADAQFSLAELYSTGQTVTRNEGKALELYKKAAAQEHEYAMITLACFYLNGEGVEIDKEKAIKTFRQLAEKGNTKAMYNLAVCYQNGEGLDQDYEAAFNLLKEAAKLDDIDAIVSLGLYYENGIGTQEDSQKAIELYQYAADQGSAEGMCNLAKFYEKGEVNEEKIGKAIKLYEQAAEFEFPEALFSLANFYESGIGVSQNIQKATAFYLRAAESGHSEAYQRYLQLSGSLFDVLPK
ncbi:hypothetical protein TRFO_01947 [Tritrichomonas foetus]|uniref:Protein kinase domain-containing protein n=1 Tax=Tritrichomonas foetus TaxID=1144522 RepID=A0A1J4JCE4_9EUKA|nr:hypothetical protein TRFO_01947 [Tritrichomonas foetus]|eukprot:OHS96874.1 hypothetical protein TRFO_01947 [Tritrichomonas foetus]